MDFRQCYWPPHIVSHADFSNVEKNSTALAALFASINNLFLYPVAVPLPGTTLESQQACNSPLLLSPKEERANTREAVTADITISFSHFVPRIELIPERRFLLEPSLARVSGSHFLEAQIRQLKPDLHIVSGYFLLF